MQALSKISIYWHLDSGGSKIDFVFSFVLLHFLLVQAAYVY